MDNLPGKEVSVWIDTTPETNYPTLGNKRLECDAAVIGAGITGLLTAWFLRDAGLSVIIIEKSRMIESTTGNSTAKLTSQHNLIYDYLMTEKGENIAHSYALANQNAIDEIEELSKKLKIDCDFSRRDAYVYTRNKDRVDEIKKEVQAAQKLGLPASFQITTGLPFEIEGAIKFSNQAQFHPRKFLLGIAQNLISKKVQIFENTNATNIISGSTNTIETNMGQIKAKYIVEATRYPFWQPNIFKDVLWLKLSYLLGAHLKKGGDYPQNMFISTDTPSRTIRSHPYLDGQILIFGGESHKIGGANYNAHYNNLITDLNLKFNIEEIVCRWMALDAMSFDRIPYIGEYPKHPNIYVATGYSAWGLAWAMAAARIITNQILEHPDDWADEFGLNRINN